MMRASEIEQAMKAGGARLHAGGRSREPGQDQREGTLITLRELKTGVYSYRILSAETSLEKIRRHRREYRVRSQSQCETYHRRGSRLLRPVGVPVVCWKG